MVDNTNNNIYYENLNTCIKILPSQDIHGLILNINVPSQIHVYIHIFIAYIDGFHHIRLF